MITIVLSIFRPVWCKYKNLGCTWNGVHHQFESHQSECLFPQKFGGDLLEGISRIASEANEELRRYQDLFQMLSYEKIAICGKITDFNFQ